VKNKNPHPNPISEMRRMNAAGEAYVINDVTNNGVSMLRTTEMPGYAVIGFSDEWLLIDLDGVGHYLRWSHITSLCILEL
jgi:hypothetical protein